MKKGKNRVKDILLSVAIVICMLLPWLIIDTLYYFRHRWTWMDGFVKKMYCIMQPYGITYNSAMNIMGGIVGIVITMVSLFLSTNINLIQRSEKNTFGITYKEMQDIKGGIMQLIAKWTRRMSYVAPVFLMMVLNLRLCVTGYALYTYCCMSVFLHYVLYISSFSRDEVYQRVIEVLLEQVKKKDDWSVDDIKRFDIRLMTVARSVKSEENWLDVENLFQALLQEVQNFEGIKQQIITNHFFRIVCCWQTENGVLPHRIWATYLREENQRSVRFIEGDGRNVTGYMDCFWGIIQGAIEVLPEQQLADFIQEFLGFAQQGIEVKKAQDMKDSIKVVLDEQILNVRCYLMLVVLENRLRTKPADAENLARAVVQLKLYGDREMYKVEDSKTQIHLSTYFKGIQALSKVHDIMCDLADDERDGGCRCCVNRLAKALTI